MKGQASVTTDIDVLSINSIQLMIMILHIMCRIMATEVNASYELIGLASLEQMRAI